MLRLTTKSPLRALALAGVLASTGLPRIAHAAALDGVQPLCAEYVNVSPTSQSGTNPFHEHASWGCNNGGGYLVGIHWGDASNDDTQTCIFRCSSGGDDFFGHNYPFVYTFTGHAWGQGATNDTSPNFQNQRTS